MNRSDTLHPDVVTPDYTRPLVVTLGLEEVPAQEQGGFGIREATSTEEVLSSLERE